LKKKLEEVKKDSMVELTPDVKPFSLIKKNIEQICDKTVKKMFEGEGYDPQTAD